MRSWVHNSSFVGCILLVVLSAGVIAESPRVSVKIETQRCEEGRILHPTKVSVIVFDSSRVPDIIRMNESLKAKLRDLNSSPDAVQQAENLYAQMQGAASKATALARLKTLPKSGYVLTIHPASKIFVLAFDQSESESFTFASQELGLSPNITNEVLLNFSSEEECHGLN